MMQCFGFASSFPCQVHVGVKDLPALRHLTGDGSGPLQATSAHISKSTQTHCCLHPHLPPPGRSWGHSPQLQEGGPPALYELAPTFQTKHRKKTEEGGGRQEQHNKLVGFIYSIFLMGGFGVLHLRTSRWVCWSIRSSSWLLSIRALGSQQTGDRKQAWGSPRSWPQECGVRRGYCRSTAEEPGFLWGRCHSLGCSSPRSSLYSIASPSSLVLSPLGAPNSLPVQLPVLFSLSLFPVLWARQEAAQGCCAVFHQQLAVIRGTDLGPFSTPGPWCSCPSQAPPGFGSSAPLPATTGVGQCFKHYTLGICSGFRVLGKVILPLKMTPTHSGTHP